MESQHYKINQRYKDNHGQNIPEYLRNDPFYMFDMYVSQVGYVPEEQVKLNQAN